MRLGRAGCVAICLVVGLTACGTETTGTARPEAPDLCAGLTQYLRTTWDVVDPVRVPADGSDGSAGASRCEVAVTGNNRLGGAAAVAVPEPPSSFLDNVGLSKVPAADSTGNTPAVYIDTLSRTVVVATSDARWTVLWILAPTGAEAVRPTTSAFSTEPFVSADEIRAASAPMNDALGVLPDASESTAAAQAASSTEPVSKLCSPAQSFADSVLGVAGAQSIPVLGDPAEPIRSIGSCTVQTDPSQPIITATIKSASTDPTAGTSFQDALLVGGPVVSTAAVGDTTTYVRYVANSSRTTIVAINSPWLAQWAITTPSPDGVRPATPLTDAQIADAGTALVGTIADVT